MAEQGLNIQNLKDRTSLSRTTISNLYNNRGQGVQFDTMEELCAILMCQPGDLFEYVDLEIEYENQTNNKEMTVEKVNHVIKEGFFIGEINAKPTFKCKVQYDGKTVLDFVFQPHVVLKISSTKTLVRSTSVLPKEFKEKLDELKIPVFVKKEIKSSLINPVVSWALETFYEEIEDTEIADHEVVFANN